MRDGCLTRGAGTVSDLPPMEAVESCLARCRPALALKRVLDVAGALILLVCCLPLMLLVAVAIRLESPGRVLFSQPRHGRRGRLFRCYKFRSMVVDQGAILPADLVARHQRNGSLLKMERDPRATRVGAWLRRWSIDELPQLWNVLKGDMSLVGPRPLMEHMLAPYPQIRNVRGTVRPGITGLWQIRDRERSSSVLHMVSHDVEYVTRYSLTRDLRILLATIGAVVRGSGAF